MNAERLQHTRGIFKGPLLRLRETLLTMASLTDRNLNLALTALTERDEQKADLVIGEDAVIDKLEVEVDDIVVTYVSTHGPMATACRLALSASKMSESLESIADQAVTIARRSKKLLGHPEMTGYFDLPLLSKAVVTMMRESIDSFVDVEPERALRVVLEDRAVDEMTREIELRLNEVMESHPKLIPACVHMLFIIRSLERAGDYGKRIAEDVYFLYTARDIRHDKEFKKGLPKNLKID
jgi:phosphate transport system protein